MLLYPFWYRLNGIRRAGELVNPIFKPLVNLEFPRDSIFHNFGRGVDDNGPTFTESIYKNVSHRLIYVKHIYQLVKTEGNPRPTAINIEAAIKNYHLGNRRCRRANNDTDDQGLRDSLAPYVINYSYIDRHYRYVRSMFAEYNQWRNKFATVMDKVNYYASNTERHNFLMLELPEALPGLIQLRVACESMDQRDYVTDEVKETTFKTALESYVATTFEPTMQSVALERMTQSLLKFFSTHEALFIMEIFKWLGPKRNESLMDVILPENYHRVNLIIKDGPRFLAINLHALDQWRDNPAEERKGLQPEQIRNRFLKLLMTMIDQRATSVVDDKLAAQDKVENATDDQTSQGSDDDQVIFDESGDVVNDANKQEPETDPTQDNSPLFEEINEADLKVDDKFIEQQLSELENIMKEWAASRVDQMREEIYGRDEPDVTEGVIRKCNELAQQGVLSAAEAHRYKEMAGMVNKIAVPDAYGSHGVLGEFIKIQPEELQVKPITLPDNKQVLDKSMLQNVYKDFDGRYVKEVMAKDTAAMIVNLQKAGICITSYEVERTEDISGVYDRLTIQLVPVSGGASKINIKLPVVNEDGTYTANNVRYRLRKQRGDIPIRKIGPDRVALTSYYGKINISRCEKSTNNYTRWLGNQLTLLSLNTNENPVHITNVKSIAVFQSGWTVPRAFSIIAQRLASFDHDGYSFDFDWPNRLVRFGQEANKLIARKDKMFIIASKEGGDYIVMDKDSLLYKVNIANPTDLTSLGTVEDYFNLSQEKAPVDYVEIQILGKKIPIGIVMGYLFGLDNLLQLLKAKPRRIPAGERAKVEPHEYAVVFADETLVFDRSNTMLSSIMAGFNAYAKDIRTLSVYDFDRKAAYDNTLENNGLGPRYTRELNLVNDLFVDPITRDLLKEMNEPTKFKGLMFRAVEMLQTDYHKDEFDGDELRLKGYERIPGAVYSELIKAVRTQAVGGRSKAPIDMSPFAVWRTITQDPAVQLVNEINPIEDCKQAQAVTYAGNGGRNSRTMTRVTRQYHRNDMGVISGDTVDSGDVGINIYASHNPQFTSLRGLTKRTPVDEIPPTAFLSTAAMLAPGTDCDDPKRAAFVGIQKSHMIPCVGYQPPIIRTGGESVIAHNNSGLFASTAKKNGKVISITDKGLLVEYEDGSTEGFKLGRQFGSNAGMTIPHMLRANIRAGETFKAGHVLAYNEGFYAVDPIDPTQVLMKTGYMTTIAVLESPDVLEDSCAISKELSQQLTAELSKPKDVILDFDQNVHNVVRVGQEVDYDTFLCIIEEAVTANAGVFDEETYDTLRSIGANAPTAKMKGVIEKIRIFYNGDKEDMSETLARLADVSDRELAKERASIGAKPVTGLVDEGVRFDGEPLSPDTLCIRFYITGQNEMTVGDKGVVANQMKTVVGRVMYRRPTTEAGRPIDLIFGAKSLFNRVVTSPFRNGMAAELSIAIGVYGARMRKK